MFAKCSSLSFPFGVTEGNVEVVFLHSLKVSNHQIFMALCSSQGPREGCFRGDISKGESAHFLKDYQCPEEVKHQPSIDTEEGGFPIFVITVSGHEGPSLRL